MSITVFRRRSWLAVVLALIAVLGWGALAAAETNLSLAGTWRGAIEIPGQPLGIQFQFAQDGDEWTGTGDIPAQGAFGLTIGNISVTGDNVSFAYVEVPASFTGRMTADGLQIEGLFQQAGMTFPFRIEREIQADSEDHADKLDIIRQHIKTVMETWQVPGVAVAIVEDGEVILAEGFGWRDVENQLPVTPKTLFGIGSSTKAFTTAVFQMLVEENLLSWDQPIRHWLPGFRLQDPWATEHITPRDFALHRSGLPRHDLAWVLNLELDPDHIINAAEHLQPAAEFRTTWIYNNFGYAVLGRLIEEVTQQSWEDVVTERILQPLGMNATNFAIEDMKLSDDYSLTYAIVDGEVEAIPLRGVGGVGPAGAINSNVEDMARWLLFQLNDGAVDGQQLLSPVGMLEMHSPQMMLGGSGQGEIQFSSYGLGWMMDSYRGHYRVHHGGNTLGFSVDVAMLPQEGIGVVVLANAHATPIPGMIVNYAFDVLLELEPIDWNGLYQHAQAVEEEITHPSLADVGRKTGTQPTHALAEYAGTYEHPAYGLVEIELVDGQLVATYYDATIPLEHWHYNQFKGILNHVIVMDIPFLFQIDLNGEISGVHIGFEVMVDPIPFVRRADRQWLEPTYLNQFVGEYELLGQVVDVSLRGETLVMTVPSQPPYRLEPVREGYFVFADYDGFAVDFVADVDGQVIRAILIQPHGNVELVRKGSDD